MMFLSVTIVCHDKLARITESNCHFWMKCGVLIGGRAGKMTVAPIPPITLQIH